MAPSLPLLSCESSVSVKENPDRLKTKSESYFPSSGNVVLNESSNPYGGDVFSVLWKPFSLIYDIFSTSGICFLKLVETHFFGERLYFS